ncbi:UPF0301 protein [Amylibacter ulvae]|uniref:UPF0301 protein GCM10008927_24640 n=1 Tax=Paramylibacter ulvae TaxID=1651968 RepID=A0ABQ3D4W7_9RHOB|nr:YqgE/AlgH family protein [Amylibacter ulvae]GHA57921.1 UPF0301 protein [Amylibacter ulvae]
MSDENNTESLDGKLLIAMPGMDDPRFEKSVVYICAHSPEGTMGLIVNKPVMDLNITDLLEQLDIKANRPIKGLEVHFGGPVEHGRGFVLHSRDYAAASETLEVNDEFGMTASLEILEDISNGDGPANCLFALGYAGWGPGQLEDELRANGWLVADANSSLVFAKTDHDKWQDAIKSMGIDPRLLSAEGGNA